MSKIFIVDGLDSDTLEIKKALESCGHSVEIVYSGMEFKNSLKHLNLKFDATTFHQEEKTVLTFKDQIYPIQLESEERYRILFENTSDSITIRTPEGRIIEANPMACQLLGYPLKKLVSKSFQDLIAPGCHAQLPNILKTLEEQGVVDYEIKFLREDGSEFLAEARCKEIQYGQQDVVMCISRDITQRKETESHLKKSEENYRRIVETAQEGILASDEYQKINYVNHKMAEMVGYKPQEVIGRKMTEFIFTEDLLDHEKRIENRRKNVSERFKRRIRHKDGSERWMIVSATPLQDDRGYYAGSFAMFTDITDIKKAEDDLKDSEKKYRSVIENAAEGIVILDKNGKIIDMNDKLMELSDLEKEDLLGEYFLNYLHNAGINPEEALTEFNNVLAGSNVKKPYWTIKAQGKEMKFIAHTAPIRTNGEINGMSIILEDITDSLKAEKEMKRSLKENEMLLKEKDILLKEKDILLKEKEVLLKEIHHRVKNNLQIISSLLNLQSNYVVNKQDQEIFTDSQSRIKSMAIVHEQLYQSEDFARIDIETYLRSLAHGLFTSYNINLNTIRLKMDVPNIKFDINIAIPLGLMINEILTNSLKHAFPCIQDGQISLIELLNGSRKDELFTSNYCQIYLKLTSKNDKFHIIVGDNGIGLPKDLDFKNTSTLGFQLINSLVKQLNGTIELNSSSGTEFAIEFSCN